MAQTAPTGEGGPAATTTPNNRPKGGSTLSLIPIEPLAHEKLGPDGKPVTDKKLQPVKTEGIKPAHGLGIISFVLILALGVGLWFVNKTAAIIVLLILAAIVLIWLGVRAVLKRTKQSSQANQAKQNKQTKQDKAGGNGGSTSRRHWWNRRSNGPGGSNSRNSRGQSSRSGRNTDGRARKHGLFRNADGTRRNPLRNPDGTRRNPFRRDRASNDTRKAKDNGTKGASKDNKPNSSGRSRGSLTRRADGSSRFRRRQSGSSGSGGGRSKRKNSSNGTNSSPNSNANNGGKGRNKQGNDSSGKRSHWYTPWRGRSNGGSDNGPKGKKRKDRTHDDPGYQGPYKSNDKNGGRSWYKPWQWRRNQDTPDKPVDGPDNSDQAESDTTETKSRRYRWYHGPGWSRHTYAGFNTDGDGHQDYHEFRPGDRWEQFKERHFSNGCVRAHATRMDGPDPTTGRPTEHATYGTDGHGTNSYGSYAPTHEARELPQMATNEGVNSMSNQVDTRGGGNIHHSATGVESSRVNTDSAAHTAASAIRHLVHAARNQKVGQQYLNSDDKNLRAAGEAHLRLAAQQVGVAENRAALTAHHNSAAAQDAQEG